MGKSSVAFIASALFVLAVAGIVQSTSEAYDVRGKVYCDPCRVQFQTKLSRPIKGALVELKCRNLETEKVSVEVTGITDANGEYNIPVKGDHEDEICEVSVKESPEAGCKEAMEDLANARVSLTSNSGQRGTFREANPIGFMVKDVDHAACKKTLDEMGFVGIDN